MSQLNAIISTISKEWKAQAVNTSRFFRLLGEATRSAALAWVVYKSGNLDFLGYLFIGVALMAIWAGAVGIGGWSFSSELFGKTLDFTIISRSSMAMVLFSKTIAQVTSEIPSGFVASLTLLLVARTVPDIANVAWLPVSLILALLGLAALTYFFATLVALIGGKAGFFVGVIPFGAVLSGFILPVNQLPPWLEVVARFVPSSWAMDSVWLSIRGTDSWWLVLQGWIICVLVSSVWFTITYFMCQAIEKRIRIQGTLGAY